MPESIGFAIKESMADKFELAGKKVWVPGSKGMVGSAIVRKLAQRGIETLATTREQVDLLDQASVEAFYAKEQPNVVVLAAAKVGGIHANNTNPADFISDNLQIQQNVIRGAHAAKVEKLLFLGSSCIYPRECPQPIKEQYLLTGPLEPTNEWYAVAKIAGIKLCQAYRRQHGCDFITAMPTNLYGPNDNFHPQNSHVPAALLQRFHNAKLANDSAVEVWGSGKPFREFLHVDDMADACIFLLENYSDELHVNVGTGEDVSIAEFATLIKQTVGFEGELKFDSSRPDGTPRKRLDVSLLESLGWTSRIKLVDGLKNYYDWYLKNV